MGWVADTSGPPSSGAAGVCPVHVSQCADCRGGSRAPCPAANLVGGTHRQGAPVDATQRDWDQWGVVVGDGIFWLARLQESSGSGRLSGLHADPVPKRRECPRTRDYQVRQPACALDDDGVGLELGPLPAGECPELLVSRALWGWGQAPKAYRNCG